MSDVDNYCVGEALAAKHREMQEAVDRLDKEAARQVVGGADGCHWCGFQALRGAVVLGDVSLVRQVLACPRRHAQEWQLNDASPLALACRAGHDGVVRILLGDSHVVRYTQDLRLGVLYVWDRLMFS